ncbi:hypothetical protein JOD55_000516 [Arcanobacterium pluranimalium]|uniref:hypothetical protein n=1 Tax=Arcanobacterium pluranimalium TaxID=108028 RepID=UPI001956722A|nr:hypothetical protein [Arcanobacterium pluranimalium]MBM7824689.1 hypothetical protein [Arcanobacterium pluranimalium]
MQKIDTYELTPVFIAADPEQDPKLPTIPFTFIAFMAAFALVGVAAAIPTLTIAAGLTSVVTIPAWMFTTVTHYTNTHK